MDWKELLLNLPNVFLHVWILCQLLLIALLPPAWKRSISPNERSLPLQVQQATNNKEYRSEFHFHFGYEFQWYWKPSTIGNAEVIPCKSSRQSNLVHHLGLCELKMASGYTKFFWNYITFQVDGTAVWLNL